MSDHSCSPRYHFLSSKMGTVLPPRSRPACPMGLGRGFSEARDKNAIEKPMQPDAPGHGNDGPGVIPASCHLKGLECVVARAECWGPPLAGPTYQSCSGNYSSGTRGPSSRAGCTCCPRKGSTPYLRSRCRTTLRGSLRKRGLEVSVGRGFCRDPGLIHCSPEPQNSVA